MLHWVIAKQTIDISPQGKDIINFRGVRKKTGKEKGQVRAWPTLGEHRQGFLLIGRLLDKGQR